MNRTDEVWPDVAGSGINRLAFPPSGMIASRHMPISSLTPLWALRFRMSHAVERNENDSNAAQTLDRDCRTCRLFGARNDLLHPRSSHHCRRRQTGTIDRHAHEATVRFGARLAALCGTVWLCPCAGGVPTATHPARTDRRSAELLCLRCILKAEEKYDEQ